MWASAVTSADAPCAPPPQMMKGRFAVPSAAAAAAIASSSISGSGGANGATSGAGPLRPHTSIAHSSTAGPRRRVPIAARALATSAEAASGPRMRAEKSTSRLMIPA